MKIVVSADHRGAGVAERLVDLLGSMGHEPTLVEGGHDKPSDYPDRAYAVGREIGEGNADRGILVCGTGIGMAIAANKMPGVRAAVVADELTANLSRSHNDANVLCLSADLIGMHRIEQIVNVFLTTPFEGGRHARRVEKIGAIERGEDPSAAADPTQTAAG